MIRGLLLLLSILMIIVSCSAQSVETPEKLNARALQILQSPQDQRDLKTALKLTGQALKQDSEYLPARSTRINIFLQMDRLDQVLGEAREILAVNDTPENQLYACMAREVAEPGWQGQVKCYLKVAQRMEDEKPDPLMNPTYLMAIKLAGVIGFKEAAWSYIKNQKSEAAREMAKYMFIESTRDDILQKYFSR